MLSLKKAALVRAGWESGELGCHAWKTSLTAKNGSRSHQLT